MQFITGSRTIPPCGFPKLMLRFKHDCSKSQNGTECACLPSANTCATVITLPVHVSTMEGLTQDFITAITNTKKYGFGNA